MQKPKMQCIGLMNIFKYYYIFLCYKVEKLDKGEQDACDFIGVSKACLASQVSFSGSIKVYAAASGYCTGFGKKPGKQNIMST